MVENDGFDFCFRETVYDEDISMNLWYDASSWVNLVPVCLCVFVCAERDTDRQTDRQTDRGQLKHADTDRSRV